LWLAGDHLMLLDSTRFSERYKRFSFGDIQSIVVTEMPPPVVLQAMAVLGSLAWMALWFAVDARFGKWSFAVTGAIALGFAIVDIARGPRCRCVLYTRESKEPLDPVSRVRVARKVLAELKPRIEAVQGALPPSIEPFAQPAPSETAPPETPSEPGYLPEIVCALFLANAGLIWATLRFPQSAELSGVLINSLLAELLLIVVALIRRKGRDQRMVVYVVMGLGLLGLGLGAVVVAKGLGTWYLTVLDKAKQNDRSVTPMTVFADPHSGQAVQIGWRAAAGIIGLAAAFWERRSKWR
jgi:hypothetical protein